jgi:CheY-like chemotaxis protein
VSDAVVPLTDTLDTKVLLGVLVQLTGGDFSARMPRGWTGVAGEIAAALNEVIVGHEALEVELARLSRVMGQHDELSERVATTEQGESARSTTDPLVGTKVLVVDDDFRNVFAMRVLLERLHAKVIVADSGPDAIAALQRDPAIDIVLMDIMMPIMDGYEAIRAIRAHEDLQTLPIIAVTGKVVPGEHQRCVEAGANDYVPKPVDVVELLSVMRPYLPMSGQPSR